MKQERNYEEMAEIAKRTPGLEDAQIVPFGVRGELILLAANFDSAAKMNAIVKETPGLEDMRISLRETNRSTPRWDSIH